MPVPDDRRYSPDHHWVQADGELCRIGLTDFAQDALGEITLVQLHDGDTPIRAGEEMGEVEAFKAMTDLYMPVEATVVDFNERLRQEPTAINTDPYGEGWICRVWPVRPDDVDTLLDASAYIALVGPR